MNRPIRNPESVPGDFYVEQDCCLSCGLPQHIAPGLVGRSETGSGDCVWKKQPSTPQEIEQAIKVLQFQELTCHRYAGRNPSILAQLDRNICDHPVATQHRSLARRLIDRMIRGKAAS